MKMFWKVRMNEQTDAEVLDKLRIRELVEYDRYCCDYGHKDEQRKLWFSDATLFTTWFKGSIDEYLNSSPTTKEKDDIMSSHSHRINNTVVWLNGSRAVAELLCSLNFRNQLQGEWVDVQCLCRMHYRVEKREGRWGIVYMEGIYEKDRMDPVFGDSDFFVPEAELRKHRPINWNMAVRRGKYLGHETDEGKWAGSDIPETLGRVYEESSRWLFAEEG